MEEIKLIECINTWQGEGPDSGQRMLLCRFKYCNMRCPWCDTIVKMRAEQEATFSIKRLQEIITQEKAGLMITGGEPTLNSKPHSQIDSTVLMLNELEYPVANVETNGYNIDGLLKRVHANKNVKYIYSPKIFARHDLDYLEVTIESFRNVNSIFLKPVCDPFSELLVSFVNFLSEIGFPNHRVFLMPLGKTRKELIENSSFVFDLAETYKFNFSSRQHIIYDFV